MKYILFLLLFFSSLSGIAQTVAVTAADLKGANTELGMLGSQKGSTVPLLAAVKDEIKVFEVTVRDPHNIDAANQQAAMAAAAAAPYDPYDAGSVKAHNDAINLADEWGKRIEKRRARESPRYEEMKRRKKEYEETITGLDKKIKDIISRFNPNCNANDAEEALVNCWAMFYDGESKRKALGDDPVYPGTNFFGSGVPKVSSDAFKTFRNEQLDKINSGTNSIGVPKPPPPPPKGAIEKATEQAIDFFKDLIYGKNRYKERRTTSAVLAVRG